MRIGFNKCVIYNIGRDCVAFVFKIFAVPPLLYLAKLWCNPRLFKLCKYHLLLLWDIHCFCSSLVHVWLPCLPLVPIKYLILTKISDNK